VHAWDAPAGTSAHDKLPALLVLIVQRLHGIEEVRSILGFVDKYGMGHSGSRERQAHPTESIRPGEMKAAFLGNREVYAERVRRKESVQQRGLTRLARAEKDMHEWPRQLLAQSLRIPTLSQP
jgi:hypothetical protein